MIKMTEKIIIFLLLFIMIGLSFAVYYSRQQLAADSAAQTMVIKERVRGIE